MPTWIYVSVLVFLIALDLWLVWTLVEPRLKKRKANNRLEG